MTLLIDPFPANHFSAFPICALFSVLSILTILLDKCHMKSFKNINILMKVKVFCSKKNFKKLIFLKKKLSFKTKKNFFRKNTFFSKKIFLAKNFLEKNFFHLGRFLPWAHHWQHLNIHVQKATVRLRHTNSTSSKLRSHHL